MQQWYPETRITGSELNLRLAVRGSGRDTERQAGLELHLVAVSIRGKMAGIGQGERTGSRKLSTQADTSSLDALQAYSLERKKLEGAGDDVAAEGLLQRAIDLDPNFAMAYASRRTAEHPLGDFVQAAENTRKAPELRERVSQRRSELWTNMQGKQFVPPATVRYRSLALSALACFRTGMSGSAFFQSVRKS